MSLFWGDLSLNKIAPFFSCPSWASLASFSFGLAPKGDENGRRRLFKRKKKDFFSLPFFVRVSAVYGSRRFLRVALLSLVKRKCISSSVGAICSEPLDSSKKFSLVVACLPEEVSPFTLTRNRMNRRPTLLFMSIFEKVSQFSICRYPWKKRVPLYFRKQLILYTVVAFEKPVMGKEVVERFEAIWMRSAYFFENAFYAFFSLPPRSGQKNLPHNSCECGKKTS